MFSGYFYNLDLDPGPWPWIWTLENMDPEKHGVNMRLKYVSDFKVVFYKDHAQSNLLFKSSFTKGQDTLWNISVSLFHETQFNAYFFTFNLISWNSYITSKEETSTNYYHNEKWIQESVQFVTVHIF